MSIGSICAVFRDAAKALEIHASALVQHGRYGNDPRVFGRNQAIPQQRGQQEMAQMVYAELHLEAISRALLA